MAKQCPRCWEKVSPDVQVCPNCGYDFVRRTAKPEKAEEPVKESKPKKTVVFPTPKKEGNFGNGSPKYKVIYTLTLGWTILALLGCVGNLIAGETLQAFGFLGSCVVCAVVFYFVKNHIRQVPASILVIVSGAFTWHWELLAVSVIVSFLIFSAGRYFDE